MTLAPKIKHALEQCVTGGKVRFMTYGAFGKKYGIGNFAPAWARKSTLNDVAAEFRHAGQLDLTFLLSNGETKYPSVIDGKPSKPPSEEQKERAKEVAQQIIDQFGRGDANPY